MATPNYDPNAMSGGFLPLLLSNLPPAFNSDPKAQNALSVTVAAAPDYAYMSVVNGLLVVHNGLYDSDPNLIQNISGVSTAIDLSQCDATAIKFGSGKHPYQFGITFDPVGTQDGTNLLLLLGFKNYPLTPNSTFTIQIATSRLWKFLYAPSRLLLEASESADNAVRMIYKDFAAGFWLDFIGDWLDIPRPPSMSDFAYIAYITRELLTPKGTNMAIEDILSANLGVPVSVPDVGYKTFAVRVFAGMRDGKIDPTQIAPIVNRIKMAGVKWVLEYYPHYYENFESYFVDRNNVPFANSDKLAVAVSLTQTEGRYGFNQAGGFMFGSGQLNASTFGFGRTLKESRCVMYYNAPTDPSYTVLI